MAMLSASAAVAVGSGGSVNIMSGGSVNILSSSSGNTQSSSSDMPDMSDVPGGSLDTLVRCRSWLHPRRTQRTPPGCPALYDSGATLNLPPPALAECHGAEPNAPSAAVHASHAAHMAHAAWMRRRQSRALRAAEAACPPVESPAKPVEPSAEHYAEPSSSSASASASASSSAMCACAMCSDDAMPVHAVPVGQHPADAQYAASPDHTQSAEQPGGASEPQPTAVPSAAAIAGIFSLGQTPAAPSLAHRAMHRLRALCTRLPSLHTSSRHPRVARSTRQALSAAISGERQLQQATRQLSCTRSASHRAFRMRADRVHLAQAQLLHTVHVLFVHSVPSHMRRSRQYRFYLPEDDQMELDRGFSESVLFAAQALARGFQIRGTERHTVALREPAQLLCCVWAAVRHVLCSRGGALRAGWAARRATVMVAEAAGHEQALRRVLEDFDDAWVRFERDLCFAYFGLGGVLAEPSVGATEPLDCAALAPDGELAELVVLLSATLQLSLAAGLLTSEQLDALDPLVMLALPRLAILHALTLHGGSGGNSAFFSDDPAEPPQVFWWFADYSPHCRRIAEALLAWPMLPGIVQRAVVAEEADVSLNRAALQVAELLTLRPQEPVPGPVDLEAIMDAPRAARSLSFDCISAVCAPLAASSEYLDSVYKGEMPGRLHARSLCEDEGLAARISACAAWDPAAEACRVPASPAARSVERQARVDACLDAARQVYVDVCAVADSLHSGPFARPFRLALELVFRMNAEPQPSAI